MEAAEKLMPTAKRMLRELGHRRLDDAIVLAEGTDADLFAAADRSTTRAGDWCRLADSVLREYRYAALEPGTRLGLSILRAVRARGTEIHARNLRAPAGKCPRYRSGIAGIDRATGGFYGVTVLAGAPGVGKSLAALRAGIQAAAAGWRVVYYDCELGEQNFASRVMRVVRSEPETYGPPVANDCEGPDPEPARWSRLGHRLGDAPFQPRDLTRLADLRAWAEDIWSFVHQFDSRVLVVLDSVNQAARMLSETGGNDEGWRLTRQVAELAREVRKETDGAVAWLLVAELNRAGGIAGKDLEYIADLDVRMAQGSERGFTQIRVAKGREGGEGDYGDHLRDWRNGRLGSEPQESDANRGLDAEDMENDDL